MLAEVFRTAFDGCGLSPEEAEQWIEPYRTREQQLKDRLRAGSSLDIAHRAGHLEFGLLLNTIAPKAALQAAADLPPQTFDQDFRASLHALGDAIAIEAAKRLSEDAVALAREWGTADRDRQIAIGGELAALFEIERRGNFADNAKRPPINSVLPHYYHEMGKGPEGNCFQISQMILGFSHLAKCRIVAFLPLVYGEHLFHLCRLGVSREIFKCIEVTGYDLEAECREELERMIRQDEPHETAPSMFHAAMAYELKGGDWLLVDPCTNVVGVLPDTREVWRKYHLLNGYREVLPGLSLQMRFSEVEEMMERCSGIISGLAVMRDALYPDNIEPRILVEQFALTELLGWIRSAQKDTVGALNDVQLAKKTVTEFAEAELGGPVDDIFNQTSTLSATRRAEAERVVQKFVYYLYENVYNQLNLMWGEIRETVAHPRVELALARYSTAAGLLGHVAEEQGIAPEVDAKINQHVFSQRILFNLAERLADNGATTDGDQVRACQVLASLPYRVDDVEALLGALRAGDTTFL